MEGEASSSEDKSEKVSTTELGKKNSKVRVLQLSKTILKLKHYSPSEDWSAKAKEEVVMEARKSVSSLSIRLIRRRVGFHSPSSSPCLLFGVVEPVAMKEIPLETWLGGEPAEKEYETNKFEGMRVDSRKFVAFVNSSSKSIPPKKHSRKIEPRRVIGDRKDHEGEEREKEKLERWNQTVMNVSVVMFEETTCSLKTHFSDSIGIHELP